MDSKWSEAPGSSGTLKEYKESMETITVLRTIEEVVADRLKEIERRKLQEEEAAQERERQLEAGRIDFAVELVAYVARIFGLKLEMRDVLAAVSADYNERYRFCMAVQPLEMTGVTAHVRLNYSYTVADLTLPRSRFPWTGVRLITSVLMSDEGPYEDEKRFVHESGDLLAVITFAITGQL